MEADHSKQSESGQCLSTKALYNLKDDPHEDTNLIGQSQHKSTAEILLKEYLEIAESGRPTVPNR